MNRHTIDIQDFTILVETAQADAKTIDACYFDEPVIAVAFYGSGNVHLKVDYPGDAAEYDHTKGLALAFYADEKVKFEHHVDSDRPLECIVIATALRNLEHLPEQEIALFQDLLGPLIQPKGHYVEGPSFFMSSLMQLTLDQVFRNKLEGQAKMMFFRSQITALLAQFFGELSISSQNNLSPDTLLRLNKARDLLNKRMDNPPSLNDLALEIGLNANKLKKSFKEHFGLPVFKYLQNERLQKAHDLILKEHLGVQEAAWQVGYDSLSSFSNAFSKKFGYRPSQIRP